MTYLVVSRKNSFLSWKEGEKPANLNLWKLYKNLEKPMEKQEKNRTKWKKRGKREDTGKAVRNRKKQEKKGKEIEEMQGGKKGSNGQKIGRNGKKFK